MTIALYMLSSEGPVTRDEIKTMVLRAVLAAETGNEQNFAMVSELAEIYCINALRADGDTKLVSAEKAERVLVDAAFAEYRKVFPDTLDSSEAVPSWPDYLPYDHAYPVNLLREIGTILAMKAAQETKAWYAHCAEKNYEAAAKPGRDA